MRTLTLTAVDLKPGHLRARISFPYGGRTIRGRLRSFYRLGPGGEGGVYLEVVTSKGSIPRGRDADRLGLGQWVTEFDVVPEVVVTLRVRD